MFTIYSPTKGWLETMNHRIIDWTQNKLDSCPMPLWAAKWKMKFVNVTDAQIVPYEKRPT